LCYTKSIGQIWIVGRMNNVLDFVADPERRDPTDKIGSKGAEQAPALNPLFKFSPATVPAVAWKRTP
jgi:hypothetical protein